MIPLELFAVILLGVWGCCVGSFLNVVIFRVPEGLSVVSPPSRCPGCETKLAWYDNVPVLGWLWLRGKCRSCKMKISPQYPLIEALTGLLFAGLTAAYYFTDLRPPFAEAGVAATWPVLGVHLCLIACMVAATVIDAKLFIIPLGITWTAAVMAMVQPVALLVGLIDPRAIQQGDFWDSLVPVAMGSEVGLAIGATIGLLISVGLLWRGVFPQSFADEPEVPEGMDPNDPDLILVHPHPRREVMKELLFLAPVIALGILGFATSAALEESVAGVNAISGVLLGYLIGGGVVWAVRILGTLMFGKEAMGLGDVHLMAAVGAVIGWRDATLAFFVAPFIGILVVLVTSGLASVLKGKTRIIPYGPSLCAATLIVMLLRNHFYAYLLPGMGGPGGVSGVSP